MRLQDTLTGTLVELPPSPEPVGIYVCGPTVYQRAHIGNARPFVVFTWLARWLREQGHAVRLVHNITDVNDRIYEAAPGRSAERALEATAWYLEDTEGFGLGMPDALPLATETMPEIIELIEDLVASGHAYTATGDVYFRVARFETYGALSGQRPDQVEEQEPNPAKEDPRDFALWKATKEGEDTSWEAPWGVGRPGWHIECSAMAAKELGPEFWIHGGGLDLVFPHHENERAQSLSVGHPFARIWMHNGMLRFTGEKMSKSVGNVETIRDVLDGWGRETALVFFLTAHWRKPIDFSDETMAAAQAQAETLRNALRAETRAVGDWGSFADALEDDFNTPAALAIMHDWARTGALDELRRGLDVFGLASLGEMSTAPADVVALAEARMTARARAGLRRGRPHSWRDRRPRMGRPGCGRRLRARPARVIRDLVYGRNAVREALRGRRSVLEVWVGERAAATLEWLSEGPKPRVRRERELTEAAGIARPPGRRRMVRAVSLCRRVGAGVGRAPAPLLPRPGDRPPKPRRRRQERRRCGRDRCRAARPRRGRRHAGRVPRVGRGGRAPAGRRRPEPGPLPRRGEGRPALGVRRERRRRFPTLGSRPHGRRCPGLRRGGEGREASREAYVRRDALDPARCRSRVAQRQRRRRGHAVRGAATAHHHLDWR